MGFPQLNCKWLSAVKPFATWMRPPSRRCNPQGLGARPEGLV